MNKEFLCVLSGIIFLSGVAAVEAGNTVVRPQIRYPVPQRPSSLPLRTQTPPLYNPYFSIYYGPLYEPYEEPCHYDETYGEWVGPCDASLDTPGYSITIPNNPR